VPDTVVLPEPVISALFADVPENTTEPVFDIVFELSPPVNVNVPAFVIAPDSVFASDVNDAFSAIVIKLAIEPVFVTAPVIEVVPTAELYA
jgi:hypothetical protein